MGVRAIWRAATFFATVALFTSSAYAEDQNRVAAATLLFDEGVRALEAGRLDEACQKLEKSQELAPSGGTLLALGECHERAGRTASAWIAFRSAAARAAAAGKSDAEASALEHAATLESKLARITIKTAPGMPSNLALLRDTSVVSSSEIGVAVPVDPGEHEIHASAPGAKTWTKQLRVAAGASVTVEVPALEADLDAGSATESSPGRTQRVLGLTASGVGAGALVGGSIFGLLALGANSDGEAKCDGNLCSQEGLDLIDQASARATVSTILFITGAALVAGGAALYFTAPNEKKGALSEWRGEAFFDVSTATLRW